jgi:hypothetical protein
MEDDIGDWGEAAADADWRDDHPTKFDEFLDYHELSEVDYQDLSGNERRRMWWNFYNVGPGVKYNRNRRKKKKKKKPVMQGKIQKMKKLYTEAREARTGTDITCPVCGVKHKKTSYQKVFDTNNGKGNCKDAYWNTVGRN